MSLKSQKSPVKPRHLDPALLQAAHDPTVGDLVAAARAGAFVDTAPARCFEHFRPLAEAVPTDGLTPFRGAPLVMHGNVKRALVAVEPGLPVAAARLRAPRIQEVYELPSLVLGLSSSRRGASPARRSRRARSARSSRSRRRGGASRWPTSTWCPTR